MSLDVLSIHLADHLFIWKAQAEEVILVDFVIYRKEALQTIQAEAINYHRIGRIHPAIFM